MCGANRDINDQPGEDVIISDHQITATEHEISLNGAKIVRIIGNVLKAARPLLERRTEGVVSDTAGQDAATE